MKGRYSLWKWTLLHLSGQRGYTYASFSTAAIATTFKMASMGKGDNTLQCIGGVMDTLIRKVAMMRTRDILDVDRQEFSVDCRMYASLLRECIKMKALEEGKRVHDHILSRGIEPDIFLGNTLINMYAKCGSMVDACQVFAKMANRNVVTWNVMIMGYAQNGNAEAAFKLFSQMQQQGKKPNKVTFINILNVCTSLPVLAEGKLVHARILSSGIISDVVVGTSLVNMYGKCGNVEDARRVFEGMNQRDVVTWTSMIAAYAEHGHGKEAFHLLLQMQGEGVKPNKVTFICMLDAYANPAALAEAKLVHAHIVDSGMDSDAVVGTALIKTYSRCGSIDCAYQVFNIIHSRDLVSWNTMIAACAQYGRSKDAFELFEQMQHEGMKMDQFTFSCILSACASLATLERGKWIHNRIIETGFESDVLVATALVSMYSKCGSIEYARRVFNKMPKRDLVSWNAMITACAQHGLGKEAFELFQQMDWKGMKLGQSSYTSILSACASIADLEQGKQVHAHIMKTGFELDVFVANALLDMYAKCGSIEDAYRLFEKMSRKDVVTWNTMITAYGQHGHGKKALQFFRQMQLEGSKPTHITFVAVLTACSHAGLVDDGHYCFDSMTHYHDITPTMDHYACMVDLFCRAGLLDEAEKFVNNMPFQPSAIVWMTLLSACRISGDVERAKRAADHALELDPSNAAAYAMLSNIYAAAGMWEDRATLRNLMKDKGLKKEPGCS